MPSVLPTQLRSPGKGNGEDGQDAGDLNHISQGNPAVGNDAETDNDAKMELTLGDNTMTATQIHTETRRMIIRRLKRLAKDVVEELEEAREIQSLAMVNAPVGGNLVHRESY